MRAFALVLLLCLLASCAGSKAEPKDERMLPSKSLYQILEETFCLGADDFRGIGIGSDESEALAKARSNMALEHFSGKITSSVEIIEQNVNEIGTSRATISIGQQTTLENPQDAKLHYSARQDNEVGVVVCMSRTDAAKTYRQRQSQLQDSIEFAALLGIKETHPKQKSEARRKVNSLWAKMLANQELLKSWGIEGDMGKSKDFRDAVENDYKDYCQTAKLHWSTERETSYSEMAFARLSQGLKIEKSPCGGRGVSLVYENSEPKCEHAGVVNMYRCLVDPSLLVASC
jgi:hypothetical protein